MTDSWENVAYTVLAIIIICGFWGLVYLIGNAVIAAFNKIWGDEDEGG